MKARKVLAGALALSVILTGMPIMSARTLAAEEQTNNSEIVYTYKKVTANHAYADCDSASNQAPENAIVSNSSLWHSDYDGNSHVVVSRPSLKRMTANNSIYLTLTNASTVTGIKYVSMGGTNDEATGRIDRCNIYVKKSGSEEYNKVVDNYICYYKTSGTIVIPFNEVQESVEEIKIEVLNTSGKNNQDTFISGKEIYVCNGDELISGPDNLTARAECTSHGGSNPNPITNLVDGSDETTWHSTWAGENTYVPNEGFTGVVRPSATTYGEFQDKNNFYMSFEEASIGKLKYTPRGIDSNNGRIMAANIYVSDSKSTTPWDIKDWTLVASVTDWANDTAVKDVTFAPREATYIRVEAKKTAGDDQANKFISAQEFEVDKAIAHYQISVSVADEAQGTANVKIKDSEGQGSSSVSAVEGTELTFTAEPAEGYKFTNWTEDGQEISADNPYDYTVGQSGKILTANFAVDKAELESVLAEADKITDLSEYQDGETKESYQAALSKAREVDKNENATVAEVTEAKSALETALAALESIKEESITATAKKAVYNVGDTVEATVSVVYKNKGTSDVTEKSTVTCNTEKTGTPEATVTYKNFSTTFSVLVVDGVALDSAITVATAKKTDGNRYLATTFSELEKELSAAETVQNDIKAANGEEGAVASGTEVTPERVAEATKNLNDAVDNLEKLCKVSVSAGAAVTAENTEAETDDAGNSFVYVEIGTKVTISASATSGEKTFTGWKWNDNVISASAKYTLYAVEDMEITPSYEANEKAEEVKQMFTKTYKSGKHCFIAKRSVPKAYKVSEYGVVITDKTGWDYYKDHEEAFKKAATRTKWTCKTGSANNGTFEARLSGDKSTKYYAKAYVTYTYTDAEGKHTVTEYTKGFLY